MANVLKVIKESPLSASRDKREKQRYFMPKILVVEDEADLSSALKSWLQTEHHIVETVDDGRLALKRMQTGNFDLVILDLLLPGLTGMEVCRQFRAAGGQLPILMLTAKTSIQSKEAGLDIGADDYMTKPFQLRELSARVRALLRRQCLPLVSVYRAGDVCLERRSCRVTKAGEVVHLLPREFILLEFLMRSAGQVFSVETLIDKVWGMESNVTSDTVRSYIKVLRRKLDTAGKPSIIGTVHGVGYKIDPLAPGH